MQRAILFFALLGPVALPGPSHAALDFGHCGSTGECATVRVPLDRAGGVPGSVDLYVERLRGEPRARGVLFAVAGGPGQAATPLMGDFGNYMSAALRKRDLIVFDQRGTGKSDPLRCPALQKADPLDVTDKAASCAESLGPRRAFYRARDSVADIEAVRKSLGVEKISLYGVSYGVKLVLNYAATHPDRVERLVLDSVLRPEGPDPFYRESTAAVPRVLEALCRRRCGGITVDPASDVAKVVAAATGDRLTATAYDGRGRPQRIRITSADLFTLLHAGDLFTHSRGEMPAAFASAAAGDAALLGRLLYVPKELRDNPVGPPVEEFSQAMFAAATCEETELPWERTAPLEERAAQARARAEALPRSVFSPFDAEAALGSDTIRLCLRWPMAPEAPLTPAGPLPDVPVLIMNGENDLRTPLSAAQAVAAEFPRSTLVTDAVGHSVLFASGCAHQAFEAFFADREPGRCKRRRRVNLRELPPRSVADLAPLAVRGARGRTLRALEATLADIAPRLAGELLSFDGEPVRAGGFRGGWIRAAKRVKLRRYVYVPGVAVSGSFGARGARFKLSGPVAVSGRVKISGGRLTGTLGGRPVSARLRLPARP